MRAAWQGTVRNSGLPAVLRIAVIAGGVAVVTNQLAAGPVFPVRVAAPELRVAGESNSAALVAELDRAFRSFQQQRLDECYQRLVDARKKRPDLPPARLMLARFHLAQHQAGPARAALEQAVAENPDYPGCYLTFGEVALAEGRRADASVHFQKVIQLSVGERSVSASRRYFPIQAHAGLATIAELRSDWQTAQSHFDAWLALDPKNALARERLARVRFLLGDPQSAFAQLQQAASDDPSLKTAETNMGLLFLEKGDLDQATQWLQRAVSQAPKDPRTHLELGFCLVSQDRADDARHCAATAADLDPNRKELKVLRGLLGMRSGDYALAEQQYQLLLTEFPGDHLARNQLAVALAEQPSDDKRRRAVELAQINAQLFPESPGATATLGWAYHRVGRTVEAEAILRSATRVSPNPNTAYFLACVLIELDQTEEAKTLLQDALRSSVGEFTFRAKALERLKLLPGGAAKKGAR